jgi:hypothetical protein
MKTWFTSLNGVITISALALLSFVGYGLLEMRYFLGKWIPGDSAAMAEMVVMLLIVGGWLRALFVAANDRQGGLVALFTFSAFNVMIGLYDLQYVLNTSMPWPEQFTVITIAIVGVVATVVAGVFLRKKQIKPN